MSYSLIATNRFSKEAKRLGKKYGSLKFELAELLDEIAEHLKSGTPLGRHCYKFRLGIRSKGKGASGESRVITYLLDADQTIYLLTIYDKSEKSNILRSELEAIVAGLSI